MLLTILILTILNILLLIALGRYLSLMDDRVAGTQSLVYRLVRVLKESK